VEIPFVEQLVHHFCSDPAGKPGLLPVIVAAAASGSRCKLPRDVLETAQRWGSPATQQATLLMLAVDDLGDEEIVELVGALREGEATSESIWSGLKVAATASNRREANFALAVVDSLSADSEDHAQSLEIARRSLVEYLTSRASTFDAARFCADLGLPLQSEPGTGTE
jgi:hypothetical protein